ncbi:MAG: hypothetical protein NVS3B21_06800 [Acidimicrobiales bacterium]
MSGRSEAGQAGGVEAVLFGLLILVGATLLLANAWTVVDAKLAARTGAREAARAFVKTPSADASTATDSARLAGRDTLAQLGWHRRDITVINAGTGFRRCAVATFVVTIPVPAFHLPFLQAGPPLFQVKARHTERVDPYRSGVPGGAAPCG